MNDLEIPAPDATDDDDVVVALETARTELERGSREDAAKWLRRAVAAATGQGRTARAEELRAVLAAFGEGQFTPRGDDEVVLSDVDDFSDETIVDEAPRLPPQVAARPGAAPAVTKIATSPTPVAQPPRPSKGPPTYGAVRVAVRRALGGKWEVRPLAERETAPAGEEEALLVPLRPGAKFG